jgi:cyclin B
MQLFSLIKERAPPLIDDFIYMSQDGFSQDQMMAMERQMLRVVQFDLGAPLSYRFLRRYARVCVNLKFNNISMLLNCQVAREDMGTLTLARYALELSLMSSRFCRMSESKIAAACLLLAKRMKGTANDTVSVSFRDREGKLKWLFYQTIQDSTLKVK